MTWNRIGGLVPGRVLIWCKILLMTNPIKITRFKLKIICNTIWVTAVDNATRKFDTYFRFSVWLYKRTTWKQLVSEQKSNSQRVPLPPEPQWLPDSIVPTGVWVATIATNSCANLKFVWLNPSWCYWVLTMSHYQDYQNPNIKSHSLRFLLWKSVSVSCKVVQWMYTGNSSALCLGFPSHRTWVDNGSSN